MDGDDRREPTAAKSDLGVIEEVEVRGSYC